MAGLLSYLADTDRNHRRVGQLRNLHENPHLVAGDAAMMAWHSNGELSHDEALTIARHLDRPRKVFGTEVMAGVYERQAVGRDEDKQRTFRNVKVGDRPGHVWHCSLSLPAEDGLLSDAKWEEIATEFVTRMGFVHGDDVRPDDPKFAKQCRWAVVRHGISENGNDHVHVVVQLVRDDGTKASVHNDRPRAQTICRGLEQKHGLTRLEEVGRAATYEPAEREILARRRAASKYANERGQSKTELPLWGDLPADARNARIVEQLQRIKVPSGDLAKTIRACATASRDEAEFVRRVRQTGTLIVPRFAKGRTDVVEGYKVAERPERGERPSWVPGGALGRDMTLPKLRRLWLDSPESALQAAAEWRATKLGRRTVTRVGRETGPITWTVRDAQRLGQLAEQLREIPAEDREQWAQRARYVAGAFSAWERRLATELDRVPAEQWDSHGLLPRPLAIELRDGLGAAADSLSKSARTHHQPPVQASPHLDLALVSAGTAYLTVQGARRPGLAGQAVMLASLMKMMIAIYRAAETAGEARRSAELAAVTRGRLQYLHRKLAELSGDGRAQQETTMVAIEERSVVGTPIRPIEQTQSASHPAAEGPDEQQSIDAGSPSSSGIEGDVSRLLNGPLGPAKIKRGQRATEATERRRIGPERPAENDHEIER